MEYIALRSGEKDWTTVAICRVLQVSEAGYYKYRRAKKKPYKYSDLLTIIYSILKEDEENVNYGVKRIFIALKNQHSFKGSYSSIYRICKKNNLLIHYKRRPKGITKADSEAEKAENLIQQDFTAEKPNEKWLTDITEIPCSDGKLYLAPILDCYDGGILSFKMDTNMKAELCVAAFEAACQATSARGMILHSDRGSQYTSSMFRKALANHGALQSMSGVGRCYDNARMESFFATLKKEKLYQMDTTKLTSNEVKTIVFRYIYYYNLRRIYSTNFGWPPLVYRQFYYSKQKVA